MRYKYKLSASILVVLAILLFSTVSFGTDEVFSGTVTPLQIDEVYTGRVTPLQIPINTDSENKLDAAIKSCKQIDACKESDSFDSQDTVYFLINVKNLKVVENSYEFVLEKVFSNADGIIYESSETVSNKVAASEAINVELIKEFFLNNDPQGEYEFSIKVIDKNSGQETTGSVSLDVN